MRLNNVYIILLFLIFVILGSLLYLFKALQIPKTNESSPNYTPVYADYKRETSWLDKVGSRSKYIPPSNLIYIKVDDKIDVTKSLKIVIDRCDAYSIFCVTRVVKELDIGATILKNGDIGIIYLASENKNLANQIIENLKRYNIHSKIKED